MGLTYIERLEAFQKANRKKSAAYTAAVVVLLFLMIFLMNVWTPDEAKLEDAGIEMNFGTDAAGYGDIQSKAPASTSKAFDAAKPNAPTPVAEKVETATPQIKAPEPEPVKTQVEPVAERSNEPSVQTVEKPTPKPDVKPTPQKQTETVKETPKNETPTPISTPANTNGTTNGKSETAQGNNNGNVKGAVGDQGNPFGSVNSSAFQGTGGSGGASLNMKGWRWNDAPDKRDASNEVGYVVIKFKIDRSGEVVSASIGERSVSLDVAEFYKKQVEEITFSPIKEDENVSPFTIGSILFNITRK
jgi:outer membrane biosynthesis protein TonB